jgi:hypothetical protein
MSLRQRTHDEGLKPLRHYVVGALGGLEIIEVVIKGLRAIAEIVQVGKFDGIWFAWDLSELAYHIDTPGGTFHRHNRGDCIDATAAYPHARVGVGKPACVERV